MENKVARFLVVDAKALESWHESPMSISTQRRRARQALDSLRWSESMRLASRHRFPHQGGSTVHPTTKRSCSGPIFMANEWSICYFSFPANSRCRCSGHSSQALMPISAPQSRCESTTRLRITAGPCIALGQAITTTAQLHCCPLAKPSRKRLPTWSTISAKTRSSVGCKDEASARFRIVSNGLSSSGPPELRRQIKGIT